MKLYSVRLKKKKNVPYNAEVYTECKKKKLNNF